MNKETHRAMQVTEPGRFELVERAITQPPAGKVRIRIEACGVCHSDILTVEGVFPGISYPRVPGHEAIGKIDALGEGVSGWTVGQRVGVGYLAGPCFHCEQCLRGDFVNCENQGVTGVGSDGGYAEVMIAGERGLVAVPDALTSADAAPLLCAGVTTCNALRNSPARPGDLVAIQGIGGLGHLGIQFARGMGFRVVAIGRGADKAPLAAHLGASRYIDAATEDPAAVLQKMGGAKVILATAASNKAMGPLVGGLKPRGRLIVVGVGADGPIELSPTALVFGSRSIEGALTGSTIDTADTLAFSVLENIRPMIETVPLENAPDAYARMMRGEARFRIVLVTGAESVSPHEIN
jgi:D-arabinose 1-dehydrogenase-like Zn-dependent alcohol dehydrogenase